MNKMRLLRYCPKIFLQLAIYVLSIIHSKRTGRINENRNKKIHPLDIRGGYDLRPSDWTGSFPNVDDFTMRNLRRFAIAFGLGDKEISSWDKLEENIKIDPLDEFIYDGLFVEIAKKLGLSESDHKNDWKLLAKKLGIRKVVCVSQIIDAFCEREYGTSVQTEGYE